MVRLRIRTLLALTMGGLVLVAGAAVLAIALAASAANTFGMLSDRSVLILDGIEGKVRDRLDSAGEVVDGLAAEIAAGRLRTAGPDAMADALQVVMATAPAVEVLLYWDRRMVRRGVLRQPDGRVTRGPPMDEANPRIRAALAAIPVGGRATWSEPVVEDGVTYVSVAARVDAADSEAVFVVAAVSLERFSAFVEEIGRRYDATAFLLYGHDRLLAHPSLASARAVEAGGHTVIPIAQSVDPVISNLERGISIPFMGSARERGVDVMRVDTDDGQHVVMYRWLEGYGEKPIAIGAYFARTEVIDELQRLAVSGVAGIIVTVIAVVAAILLGGLIARPVSRLALSASAVARLDLDGAAPAPASTIAEVDEQARAFNLMLDALKVFETYVPRRLVQRLVARGGGRAMPSEIRELTVMFTDIESFTVIAERMGAEETAAFLNRHFGLLGDCISAENGTIDKYIGDAVMAFWGAPDRMDDHAVRAVRAALEIARSITADNRRRARKGLRPVRVRIGLHSGPAVVGNIGAPDRVNYTIIGDTVNVAHRLESLGHRLDAGADVTILVSAGTAALAGLGPDVAEDVGAYRLDGVPQAVAICRLRDPQVAAAQRPAGSAA